MRILILLVCSCFLPIVVLSQITSTVDYEDIETEILSVDSEYYYPLLMTKFLSKDSVLTETENLYVYYGWVFQDAYSPIENINFQDTLTKYMNFEHGYADDIEMLLSFCDSVLIADPFNLDILNYKLYFCSKLNNVDLYNSTKRQMKIIFDAISLSGNGSTMKDAIYVVDQSHVPCAMKVRFHSYMGESTIIEGFQYIKTSKNGVEDMLYFNIEPSLNYISEM